MKNIKKYLSVVLATAIVIYNTPNIIFAQISSNINFDNKNLYNENLNNKLEEKSKSTNKEITKTNSEEEFLIEDGILKKYYGSDFEVVIPSGVIAIGEGAFSDNYRVEKVVIPQGVISIGDRAFRTCISLTEVEFPDTLVSIGEDAFKDCALKKLILPDSVKEIGKEAFFRNDEIEEIKFSKGLTKLENQLFLNNNKIKKITIPENITYIGYETFYGWKALEEITLHDNIEFLEEGAFRYCENLKEINIPKKVTTISKSLFEGCKSLVNIELDERITDIGASAFEGCESLQNINIPKNIIKLNDNLFNRCYSLSSIDIPESVTEIGVSVFENCKKLKEIKLPEHLIKIGKEAFEFCTFESIYIPQSVETMDSGVFSYCSNLKEVNIPDKITYLKSDLFRGCSSLDEINIHDNITGFGSYAFNGCISLKEIRIPDNMKYVNKGTFGGCQSLESITLPSTIERIDWQAFKDCTSLSEINLQENLKELGYEAFRNCKSLKNITIPSTVKRIDKYAFKECDDLVFTVYEFTYGEAYMMQNNKKHNTIRDISNVDVNRISKQIFTGKSINPKVVGIYNNEETLKEGTDYILEYKNNTNVGIGTIIIKGRGKYYGTQYVEFEIIPKSTTSFKVDSTTTSTVNLSWKRVSSADGYVIYRYNTTSKKYVRIGTVEGNRTTFYKDEKRVSATIYNYRIKPIKRINNVTYYGNYTSAKAVTNPLKPTIAVKSTSSKSVTINWNKINRASGYKIYRATSSKGKYTLVKTIKNGDTLTYKNTGLTKSKTYHYKVKSYRTVDNTNYYSSYSSVKSAKSK